MIGWLVAGECVLSLVLIALAVLPSLCGQASRRQRKGAQSARVRARVE
jgi:hypothetical protein